MPAPRIVFENAADKAHLAGASRGEAVVGHLLSDRRSEVWRADGPATLTLTWAEPQSVDTVVLARANLSIAAEITVSGWLGGVATLGWIGGGVPATLGNWWGKTTLSGYSARAGNAGYAQVTIPQIARVDRLDITIADSANAIIEAARLIVGVAWQPQKSPQWGMEIKFVGDSSGQQSWQSDAGDQLPPPVRHIRRSLALTLPLAGDDDRDAASYLAAQAASGKMLYINAAPDARNHNLTRDLTIYGYLPTDRGLKNMATGLWSTEFVITEF